MIKSDELRLWNFVFDKEQNKIDIIDVIEENRVSLLYSKFPYTPINLIQPVELTPDILEAAGCKKDVIDGWNLWVNGNLFVIRKLVSSNGYTLSVGDYCLCDMEYLHTFQNAYYCLTGEELQIDITKLNKEK